MRLVPGALLVAAAFGFLDGGAQAAGHGVGVEDDPAIHIARGAADGLDEAGLRAQEPLLVGIENGDQGTFGDVQPLAQQVDADQHVEHAQAQIADDLDALQRVHVGVQVADLDALLGEIIREVFGHALGQHRYQHAAGFCDDEANLREQIIHLPLDRPDFGDGVDQPRGADDLFGEHAAGAFHLPGAGGGADEDGLRAKPLPFIEFERAVVDAGGQAEAELGEHGFARMVTAFHAADLRHGDVAFIDHQKGVFRQVFEQRRRRLAGFAAGEVAGIILDAFAGAGGLHHLDVEGAALLQAFGLQQFAFRHELIEALFQLHLDVADGLGERGARGDVMAVGVDGDLAEFGGFFPGERVELGDGFDLVAK